MAAISLFLAATTVAIAPPSPPPILAIDKAPVYAPRPIGPPTTFDVEVRAGGEVVWSGTMRLSDRSPASFSRQKSDASVASCPQAYNAGDRSSLSINLTGTRLAPDKAGYGLRVTWERPGNANDCSPQRSSRTIGLTEAFAAEPGQEVMISGDGGLTIRLRRR